jgi:hypothetical protein
MCLSTVFFSRAGPVEAHWAQLQITFLEGIGFFRFKTCPAISSVGIILNHLSIIPTLHCDIISDVTVMLSSHSDARLGLMKNDDKNVFFGNVSSFLGLF